MITGLVTLPLGELFNREDMGSLQEKLGQELINATISEDVPHNYASPRYGSTECEMVAIAPDKQGIIFKVSTELEYDVE